MVKKYLILPLRSLLKRLHISILNLLGLSLGMAVAIMIMLFVIRETSIDRFNENFDRIFHVQIEGQYTTSPGIGHLIADNIPEVKKVVRFKRRKNYLLTYNKDNKTPEAINLQNFSWVDSSVFDIFSFDFIYGDKSGFNHPFSIVLTETLSKKFFGNQNPVGNVLVYQNNTNFTVAGVIKDPVNFHLQFEAFVSYETLGRIIGDSELTSFNSWNLNTYVLLHDEDSKSTCEKALDDLFNPLLEQAFGQEVEFELLPLKEVYFSKNLGHTYGDKTSVLIFLIIVIFIILIAGINYINLTTARASERLKEIGIKMVVGAARKNLITHLLLESVILTSLSLILGFVLAELSVSIFNRIIEQDLEVGLFYGMNYLPLIIIAVLLLGIIAGIVPALYLTIPKPAVILKSNEYSGRGAEKLRRVLSLVQFVISCVLIAGTLIVIKQLNHVKNLDLGINEKNVMMLNINNAIRGQKDVFRQRLLENPEIQKVSFSQGYPGFVFNNELWQYEETRNGGIAIFTVDPDFIELYGIEILEGRNFMWENPADMESTCLISETMAKGFGLEDPVGKFLHQDDTGGSSFSVKDIEIIGVVKDFHFESMNNVIRPLMLGWNGPWEWNASIRLSGNKMVETRKYIENIWNEMTSPFPFQYKFVEDSFDGLYSSYEKFGKLIGFFSIISIFIAILGLFGLSSFMVEKKMKEIGLRKTFGASRQQIGTSLSVIFLKWVFIAFIISIPLVIVLMNIWLREFAFRIQILPDTFLYTLIILTSISLLTVIYQSIHASGKSPAEILKYE